MKSKIFIASLVLVLSAVLGCQAQDWSMKEAPLMTKWASRVNPDSPLPEYPRPQMVRAEWMNLNGIWEYKSGYEGEDAPVGQTLGGKILVPYPVESALSGVMEHHERLWYRRTFEVPAEWAGKHILLHFGAIDWESEIYINGVSMGVHKGGYDPFSIDITGQLNGTGEQEVLVRVYDPTNYYGQARGKQTLIPGGIMYTSTTGIWQTVWMEPVEDQAIVRMKMIPDIDSEELALTIITGAADGLSAEITAYDNGTEVGSIIGACDTELHLPVPSPKLWSPSSPFLYDLKVVLKKDGQPIDSVGSYFGMRKISIEQGGGIKRMYLNNEFLFQIGPLDQGFWPDGIYTAPTDSALRSDIAMSKEMGFNMIRKHIKVEPMRWYYWADKLGMLVWQDMPSVNSYNWPLFADQPIDTEQFRLELQRLIELHISVPSIISWVIFNEGQGQHDTEALVALARSLDDSRPINEGSGWSNYGAADVLDVHTYPEPSCPVSQTMVLACGEYGGIGLKVDGHMWTGDGSSYIMVNSPEELLSTYDNYADKLINLNVLNGLSAAVYTEITDVETELNGMLTYDRIPKLDPAELKAVNDRLTEVTGVSELLPTSQIVKQDWKYTTSQPIDGWTTPGFDDSGWKSGKGGFGTSGTPGATIGTTWNTADIWLRQEFNLGELSPDKLKRIAFSLHHDEAAELYINGVLACQVSGYTSNYMTSPINSAALDALKENSTNTLAVHCHQTTGGQYIDAGIVNLIYARDTTCAFNPNPAHGSQRASTSAMLSWHPGRLASEHKVYLGTSPELTESQLLSTQSECFLQVDGLLINQDYYWRVDELGPYGTITGLTWTFSLMDTSAASLPYPANGGAAPDTTVSLHWTPGNYASSHKIYFGSTAEFTEAELLSTQADSFLLLHNLLINNTYYWKIVETNPLGDLNGPVWQFTTPNATKATSPNPSNAASNRDTTISISWKAGRYANSHLLYMGLSESLTEENYIGEFETASYKPKGLAYDSRYYWRVDEVFEGGLITGSTWYFSTKIDPVTSFNSAEQNTFMLYPNPVPADGLLVIKTAGGYAKYEILEICSTGSGAVLYQQTISENCDIQLDLSGTGLCPGGYILRLSGSSLVDKISQLILY